MITLNTCTCITMVASDWSLKSFPLLSMLPLYIQQQAWKKRKNTSVRINNWKLESQIECHFTKHSNGKPSNHTLHCSFTVLIQNSRYNTISLISLTNSTLSSHVSSLVGNLIYVRLCYTTLWKGDRGRGKATNLAHHAMVTSHFCLGFNSTVFMHTDKELPVSIKMHI